MKKAKPVARRAKAAIGAAALAKSASGKTKSVKIMRFEHARGLPLPAYQTTDAAGMDLVAALPDDAPISMVPGQRAIIPTGIAVALPPSTEAQVRPRSGLAAKHGVTLLNSPGTIDADYRGEISVILINLGSEPVVIRRGDRIAQMVLAPVTRATLVETTSLDKTKRGTGGFGSTGVTAGDHGSAAPEATSEPGGSKRKTVARSSSAKKSRSNKTVVRAPR